MRPGQELHMTTHQVPGAVLALDDRGDGPAVVQLHGLTSSRARDETLRLDLTAGLDGHRVLRYDARGHGRSTGRPETSDYLWPRLADDLLDLLAARCAGDPVAGVGQSMGTATLLHAALRDPGRFSRLVLALPPTAWQSRVAQREVYRASAELVERRGVGAWTEMSRLAPRPPAVDPQIPLTAPDVAEALVPSLLRGAAGSDLPDLTHLTGLRLPTLILAWEGDAAHPLSTARALSVVLPDSHLVIAATPAQVVGWPALVAQHLRGDLGTGLR